MKTPGDNAAKRSAITTIIRIDIFIYYLNKIKGTNGSPMTPPFRGTYDPSFTHLKIKREESKRNRRFLLKGRVKEKP
jgi:hypothetical protein